ncbi:hypothetical protein [Mycobacterium montefiorense]|uniref:Uncharacterized protein n=1 Tax=Mycobacterium montefiorense TaxID=154654 RepID=A0AA37V011_9MYCO|nr:hypothetical protein [Mycobacterium montefiorense]GBG35746.1 hypothetical protein MmonteBS_01180 [Mycobacterium montefiorense]GKU35895.1 hypothetical protein NJB14191_32410 [Mycobacterium montefiorense]GKU41502.1 hypothetical protein NJB14192_34860 [Mycobacterium montefiorense]GKU44336.1 hypothetical protein NJB14194_09640 [Mycobacterium montefiorense]GKU51840.1 hypothetical protein NJB14195_30840 [Mycobacterium montefiorense]
MTLTDPREALADQSNFIGYLVGLAGAARMVHNLADDNRRVGAGRAPDDFVHALLGLASVGAAIERLSNSTTAQQNPTAAIPAKPITRWLR